ncbi:aspartate kinase [Algoriella xinjiangensis]|uniref:Aspartokinase n=1 Tax=Algoriella xinjiangensis TaxID=684065 RepID=A0A1I4ZHD3_9FLAO|nr:MULTISPECIES: aspartate kinase [Algoriella]MBO6212546.1 aspartate kinase [Algoriella sp.]SFN49674.1 aspartate kinase [Algoriella xinjiangensis]VDH17556.1 Lysine-sensitive aspartokinase 3 [Algoriella xinjiangensis]
MKVFKFGGASVKDAAGVRNVADLLQSVGYENTCMIVSAMGKTTNALEEVVKRYFENEDFEKTINAVKSQHLDLAKELFENADEVSNEISQFFDDIISFLRRNKSPNYSYVYDQIVCCGELISTKIISMYLNSIQVKNEWLDVRDYIKTDNTYREGKVDWKLTEESISRLSKNGFYITQGFLGSDPNFFTTTLGREGSDYSAAIFAYCLNADNMTIWKDVPGVLNADPRYFENAELLNHISYEEAIELAYYGASVIHPKTLQPLQQKEIPFFVKSFINPTEAGTEVAKGQPLEPSVPCFILKREQHLIRLSSKDFSFITEDKLSGIFNKLYDYQIKVNLMQNSAISLSLCLEDKYDNLEKFVSDMNEAYKVHEENNVLLYTIRHFDDQSDKVISKEKELLRQTVRETLQIVVKA